MPTANRGSSITLRCANLCCTTLNKHLVLFWLTRELIDSRPGTTANCFLECDHHLPTFQLLLQSL